MQKNSSFAPQVEQDIPDGSEDLSSSQFQQRKNGEATLKDVARLAKVSLATVSNVVNRKFGKMTDDTRTTVERAIAALKYRPMANARALRLERRFIAGMLIVDPAASFLANPFIAQLVAGYSNELWANGCSCLLNGVRPDQVESSAFVRYSQTDGLCVFQSGPTDARRAVLRRLASLGEPIVAIEEPDLPAGDIASVRQDNFTAGVRLASEMIRRGAKRIIVLTPNWIWPAMQERIEGVKSAIATQSLAAAVDIAHCGDGHAGEAEPVISRLLGELSPDDCLIAGTDRMLAALSLSLSRIPKRRQPLTAAFRGIDDLAPIPANVFFVYQPAYELGAYAARTLMRRILDGAFSRVETIIPLAPGG